MPVRRDRAVAERTGIGHQADFRRRLKPRAEDVIAAVWKLLARRQTGLARIHRGELLVCPVAYEPARLVVDGAGLLLEVSAPVKDRPGREQRAKGTEALRLLRQPHDVAVVRIAE